MTSRDASPTPEPASAEPSLPAPSLGQGRDEPLNLDALRERLESVARNWRISQGHDGGMATLLTEASAALLSSAEAREEAEREKCAAEVYSEAVSAALQAAETRAQQAEARVEALTEAVGEAEIQITYLHEKFGETGSGNAVLARLRAVLGLTEPQAIQQGEDNG